MAEKTANQPQITSGQLDALLSATGIDPHRGGAFSVVSGYFQKATKFEPKDRDEVYYTARVGVSGGSVKISCDPESDAWKGFKQMKEGTPVLVVCTSVVNDDGLLKCNASGYGSAVHIVKAG